MVDPINQAALVEAAIQITLRNSFVRIKGEDQWSTMRSGPPYAESSNSTASVT